MIIRYSFPLFLFLFVCAIGAPAQAQTASCSKSSSTGVITLSGTGVGHCHADALEVGFTFKSIGVCKEFPAGGIDFSSCYSFIDKDKTLTITKGSDEPVKGFIPPADSYDYSFAIVGPSMHLKGVVEFAEPVFGGDGSNTPEQGASGKFCQPPVSAWTTGDIFDRIYASQCSPTEPTGTALNDGVFVLNNVGLFGQSSEQAYGPNRQDLGPKIVPSAVLNLVLLDSTNSIASGPEQVTAVAMIARHPSPIVIEEGQTIIDATFSTINAFGFTFGCNNGQSCTLFTPYLGAGAFSGTVIEASEAGAPGGSQ